MIEEYIPKISVVMSVYKEPVEWLRESIDSILNQTFSDFEFIIICDNPDYKEGIELLETYKKKDNRIVLIYNEQNIGLTKSLNRGLSIARGEYIARMDADDISLPDRFETQLGLFKQKNDIDVCGTNAKMIGARNDIIICPQYNEQVNLFLDNCFVHSSVMMKKKVAVLKYNELCRTAQDYELWLRAQQAGFIFYNIQQELILYRISENQITRVNKRNQGKVASGVRRKSLNMLLESKGVCFRLEKDADITLNFVDSIYKYLEIDEQKKQKLLFYLLLSAPNKTWDVVFFLIRSGVLTYLPLSSVIRIIVNTVTRKTVLY